MISRNGVFIRLFIALILFLLPIAGLIQGPVTPLFGIMAVVELATALNRFSPVVYFYGKWQEKRGAVQHSTPDYSYK
ncbi:MAG: YgaP-like transmembrane domain [Methylocystaceae bacterium]